MATPRVTIDELPEHLTPVDADLLVVQNAGVSKKMSIDTLKTLSSDALTAHLADTTDAHDASAISATTSGTGVDGITVQAQLGQLAALVGAGGVDAEAAVDAVAAALVEGDDIDIVYSDVGNTITISSTVPAGPTGPPGADAEWMALTQDEYDALSPPDPDTLYVIIPG